MGSTNTRQRRVRIAAVQYLLRPIASFVDLSSQVDFFVRSARETGVCIVAGTHPVILRGFGCDGIAVERWPSRDGLHDRP